MNIDSLYAAIDGNTEGMSHGDLVLTCRMLERGRAAWRKEAEEAKALNAELSGLLKRAALVIERNLERRLGIIDEIEVALFKAEALK